MLRTTGKHEQTSHSVVETRSNPGLLTAESVHLGPTAIPQEETAERVTLEPNFYYPQEDYLWEFCKKNGCEWNVVMPSVTCFPLKEVVIPY